MGRAEVQQTRSAPFRHFGILFIEIDFHGRLALVEKMRDIL